MNWSLFFLCISFVSRKRLILRFVHCCLFSVIKPLKIHYFSFFLYSCLFIILVFFLSFYHANSVKLSTAEDGSSIFFFMAFMPLQIYICFFFLMKEGYEAGNLNFRGMVKMKRSSLCFLNQNFNGSSYCAKDLGVRCASFRALGRVQYF